MQLFNEYGTNAFELTGNLTLYAMCFVFVLLVIMGSNTTKSSGAHTEGARTMEAVSLGIAATQSVLRLLCPCSTTDKDGAPQDGAQQLQDLTYGAKDVSAYQRMQ